MLTKKITYINLNDEEVTETAMFHLSTPELVRLDVQYEGGLEGMLNRFVTTKDPKGIMEFFEKIISMAYGVKSEDGRSFRKSDELSRDFMQSPAYDELFMELLSDEKTASAFFNALVPKQRAEQVKQKNNVARG